MKTIIYNLLQKAISKWRRLCEGEQIVKKMLHYTKTISQKTQNTSTCVWSHETNATAYYSIYIFHAVRVHTIVKIVVVMIIWASL